MSRLQDQYRKVVVPAICKRFGYQNTLQAPRLSKIVINAGVGEAAHDAKWIEVVVQELSQITGQHPVVTRAKKSISNFKIREGSPVGCRVTLRGKRMYEFMDRFVNITLPRIRDFRGIPVNAFDQQGNYTLGLKEQTIFPEIEYDRAEKIYGMDITWVIRGKGKEESQELLKLLGMPFRTS